MMTQTPLSAARSTRRGEKLPTRPGVSAAARSSSFKPQASSLQNVYPELRRAQPHPRTRFAASIQFLQATDRGSRATEILIANARLEFHPTHRKISHLKISNRERIAILHFTPQPLHRAASLSFPPSFPEGRGFIPSVKNPGRSPSPLAQLHPRNVLVGFCRLLEGGTPTRDHAARSLPEGSGFIPSVNNPGHRPAPLAQLHPRKLSSLQPQASSLQNLIANLELEFRLTHRKISPLRISNRKYFAIFHLTSQSRRLTSPNFQNGNPFGAIPLAQLHPRKPLTSPPAALRLSSLRFSLATRHSPPTTYFIIDGSAIRNHCKALKT